VDDTPHSHALFGLSSSFPATACRLRRCRKTRLRGSRNMATNKPTPLLQDSINLYTVQTSHNVDATGLGMGIRGKRDKACGYAAWHGFFCSASPLKTYLQHSRHPLGNRSPPLARLATSAFCATASGAHWRVARGARMTPANATTMWTSDSTRRFRATPSSRDGAHCWRTV